MYLLNNHKSLHNIHQLGYNMFVCLFLSHPWAVFCHTLPVLPTPREPEETNPCHVISDQSSSSSPPLSYPSTRLLEIHDPFHPSIPALKLFPRNSKRPTRDSLKCFSWPLRSIPSYYTRGNRMKKEDFHNLLWHPHLCCPIKSGRCIKAYTFPRGITYLSRYPIGWLSCPYFTLLAKTDLAIKILSFCIFP